MSLSCLETSELAPRFLQLYFFMRLILEENWRKSFKISRKAFCGNGFIHLNIAEIHEEDIGGQKTCAPIADQSTKMGEFTDFRDLEVKFVKDILGRSSDLQL
jgi:hypothetical protein